MANATVFTTAFETSLATQTFVEPQPFDTLSNIIIGQTTATADAMSFDGRMFSVKLDFFLVSDSAGFITDWTLFNQNTSVAATITDLNVAIDAVNGVPDFSQIVAGLSGTGLSVAFDGPDSIFGAGLDDFVLALQGNDLVLGFGGNDTIYGNQNEDMLYGNQGDDNLFGGQGLDVAFGGQGQDVVYGNFQDDVIYGNFGSDTLYGGQDDDFLFGGQNGDVLFGNKGDDFLNGDQGNDQLIGGTGADDFVFFTGSGFDAILDFEDNIDRVLLDTPIFNVAQAGSDAVITLETDETLLVLDISITQLIDDIFVV